MKGDVFIEGNSLILKYTNDFYSKEALLSDLQEKDSIYLKGLNITKNDLYKDGGDDDDTTLFCIGDVDDDFAFLKKNVFEIDHLLAFQKELLLGKSVNPNFFTIFISARQRRINVAKVISDYAGKDCFIVNDFDMAIGKDGVIPISTYLQLLSDFPTPTELQKYRLKRIETVIGDFFSNKNEIEEYEKYMNKKFAKKGDRQKNSFISLQYEIEKYEHVVGKLRASLENLEKSEKEWQEDLVPAILLLYPRYVRCLQKVPVIRGSKDKSNKEMDYLLVDIDGNSCILELKKPFSNKSILTNSYRKNFYQPKFELAGGVQQIESYIYDLNLYKKENRDNIQQKFSNELGQIDVNLIDVQGILICGRSADFNEEEKRDFEIIRNQYKNVVDIVTYDDLISRIDRTIALLKERQ